MYEKILVAIDESEAAERVLAAAEELAKLSSGEIWLLHVWEGQPTGYKSLSARSFEDTLSWLKTECAAANDVGVIVMGSRGRNGVTDLLAGSTTHKVIHLADRPVVVVR